LNVDNETLNDVVLCCVCIVLDIKPFGYVADTERHVTEGDAVVFDLPPVDSCPPASVQWIDAVSGRQLARTAESHHVTLTNELVILNARYHVHNNAVFRAVATNGYTRQNSSSPLYVLRVQEREYIFPVHYTLMVYHSALACWSIQ